VGLELTGCDAGEVFFEGKDFHHSSLSTVLFCFDGWLLRKGGIGRLERDIGSCG
jgi:hypothetical protein